LNWQSKLIGLVTRAFKMPTDGAFYLLALD